MNSLIGLGRIPSRDDRATRRSIAAPVLAEGRPITSRYWIGGPVLDQGNTDWCVEFSGRAFLSASPVRQSSELPYGQIYDWCRKNDEWPGEDYDGTSVHALMRWMKTNGYIESYEWATTVEELHAHITTRGPAVVGTDWTMDMFTPDRWGYIRPEGSNAGGHAWTIRGSSRVRLDPYTKSSGAFRKRGSWGANWGQKGEAWINWKDMQTLIDRDGEVALPIEIKRVA